MFRAVFDDCFAGTENAQRVLSARWARRRLLD
jgi:hypothetical protein